MMGKLLFLMVMIIKTTREATGRKAYRGKFKQCQKGPCKTVCHRTDLDLKTFSTSDLSAGVTQEVRGGSHLPCVSQSRAYQ